jgi:hypothetical protein
MKRVKGSKKKSSAMKRKKESSFGFDFLTTRKTYRKGGGTPPDRATDYPGPKVRRKR